jgi:hypothetical protein
VLIACWSPKGGSGTTVVSAGLALVLARHTGAAVAADLTGDLPAALGVAEPSGPGLAEWLAAGASVPPDGLRRIEVAAASGLALLPWCGAPGGVGAESGGTGGEALAGALGADGRAVVVDCGRADRGPGFAVAAEATRSLLVLRPCYLALRRAVAAPLRPSGIVLVEEPFRSLRRHDVQDALGVPIVAVVDWDATIHRAVDAGLLAGRLPRPLERALRPAVVEAAAA